MNDIAKSQDEIYCPECGRPVKRHAAFCIYCGAQLKEVKASIQREEANYNSNKKSRAVAVVLAVFFGYWSWIYTYGKNGFKFWVAFAGVPAVIITIAHFLKSYGNLFVFIGFAAIWIWAIADNAVRSNSFYENYPKG